MFLFLCTKLHQARLLDEAACISSREMKCMCDHFQLSCHSFCLQRMTLYVLNVCEFKQCYGCHCLWLNSVRSPRSVYACYCTSRTNTASQPALKVDPGRKIACCTGELNLHQYSSRSHLMLNQLSYSPIQCFEVINVSVTLTTFCSGGPIFAQWVHKMPLQKGTCS